MPCPCSRLSDRWFAMVSSCSARRVSPATVCISFSAAMRSTICVTSAAVDRGVVLADMRICAACRVGGRERQRRRLDGLDLSWAERAMLRDACAIGPGFSSLRSESAASAPAVSRATSAHVPVSLAGTSLRRDRR